VSFTVAIVEKLDGQPVERPFHARCAGGNAHRQRSFIADGKLDQHMRQLAIVKLGKLQHRALAEHAHPGQGRQLHRKRADTNQDDAEGELKELGKTVHGDRSGPHVGCFY
jgi:hypothetical protein